LTRISRRKRKPLQNGVQAIFSDGSQGRGRPRAMFASYEFEDEVEPTRHPDHVVSRSSNFAKSQRSGSSRRFSRILVVVFLAVIMSTMMIGFSEINQGPQHHTDLGTSRSGTGPPVKTTSFRAIAPTFYAVSNLAEAIVSNNESYTGMTATSLDDFIVIQIAYSQGTVGNLPDIAMVTGTQSTGFTRVASASAGVAENFWEQVWTGRAFSTRTSTNITASPDWSICQKPCVSSIIIAMTIGRYRGVAGIGSSTSIAPTTSSTSQSVKVTPIQPNSTLVELLSHGAYSSCGIDAPQPDTGQTSRNCFTATTERTELFDHPVSATQTYTESYTWSQVEVQRGIYLELRGNTVPNPVQP
jgi:hypothetical protein